MTPAWHAVRGGFQSITGRGSLGRYGPRLREHPPGDRRGLAPPGDLGVIAEADAVPTGAAWLRFFPPDHPGYGFVAPDVPELTIGVTAAWRGRGVGRALLRAVTGAGAQAGITRVSLSVERKNFARALYLAEGFTVVDASDPQSDTMVKQVAGPAQPR
jgi:GNAT superfamily N-acetyltransferase